jgi:hypothetical protein
MSRLFVIPCVALLLGACSSGHDSTGTGSTLTVAGTFPANGASDVAVDIDISASLLPDIDPSSVSGTSLLLSSASGGVSGNVVVRGNTVGFVPSAPLAAATTYTATLAASIRGTDGGTLGNAYQWSFTTAAPVIPLITLPLDAGRRWRYARNDTTTIVAASTGVTTLRFTGERYAWVAEQLGWQSRAAARLVMYDYNSTPSSGDPEFTVEEAYVSQDANGVARWAALASGGEWRPVLSRSAITNGAFLFSQGPTQGHDLQNSASTAAVPAGNFTTVAARHFASQHEQYATATWDEDRREDFADGVGLVRSRWSYFYDDKDPQAADISQHGSIALLESQPTSPVFLHEAEANDTASSASAPALPRWVVEGATLITDAGSTLTNAAVQCPVGTAECVHPNKNGQIKLQDWYRITLTAATNLKIELAYQYYDDGSAKFNDLDLYVFQAVTGGGLKYVSASVGEAGKPEWLTGSLAAGTYYIAVQAWDTPGSAVRYWLSFR